MRTILFIFFFNFLFVSGQDSIPISYSDLIKFSRKAVDESISSGDRISIVVSEVILQEFEKENPGKILEINCSMVNFDGTKRDFSVVHRDLFEAKEDGAKLDQGFFILRDVSLLDVEKLQFKIGVRSINQEQSKLFNIISSLLTSAIESNPAIASVRSLLKTQGEVKEEIPYFNATYYLPTNYINFYKIKEERLNLPYLFYKKDNHIAFKSASNMVPKNKLKNIFNHVIGTTVFEDKEEIGGIITLKVTKSTPKPLQKTVYDKLYEVFRIIKNSQLDKLQKAIDEAYATLEIVYSNTEEKKSSAYENATYYLSLASCYSLYLDKGNPNSKPEFLERFRAWNIEKNTYVGAEDYSFVPIKDFYVLFSDEDPNSIRVVNFFVPNNLPNDFIFQSFSMQNEMHNLFKKNSTPEDIKGITVLLEKKS